MGFTAGVDEEVPVLIVGGGGAGLTASMLLARQGVDHLLVSARPTTSDLPKAHVLNQRAMEVLEDVGVAEAIAQRSTPAEQMAATAFYAGFTGPDPDYGRRLARLECWGAGGEDEFWRAASPWRQLNLPQIRLEPLLKARAEELSPDRIRFKPPARRAADRSPRRRSLRPALRLAPSPRDRERWRDPRAARPVHRVASAERRGRPSGRAGRRFRPNPRPPGGGRRPVARVMSVPARGRPEGLDFDVAIVGYGPVGQALAALLGRAGHRVGVFERFREIPRSGIRSTRFACWLRCGRGSSWPSGSTTPTTLPSRAWRRRSSRCSSMSRSAAAPARTTRCTCRGYPTCSTTRASSRS